MGELKGKYRSLQVFLDSCVKCGACTDKCHYYLGTTDPKNSDRHSPSGALNPSVDTP